MSLMVAVGFSSITQCPELGTIASVTLFAAARMTVAIIGPKDFSPPTARTGIASFPFATGAIERKMPERTAADDFIPGSDTRERRIDDDETRDPVRIFRRERVADHISDIVGDEVRAFHLQGV